jgi:hypothetical protein
VYGGWWVGVVGGGEEGRRSEVKKKKERELEKRGGRTQMKRMQAGTQSQGSETDRQAAREEGS